MKPWPPRPRRADGTQSPALLALLLALLAVVQVVSMPEIDPSTPTGPQRPLVLAPIRIAPITAPAEIVAGNVFSAARSTGTGSAEALSGVLAVGIVRDRGAARAFVTGPDGKLRTMRRGDAIDGWRLERIAADALVFARGDATVRLALSAGKAPETVREGVDQ